MISRKLTAVLAASMIFGSSAAVAQSAQPLSLSQSPAVRAGAPTQKANQLEGTTIWIIGAIVVGLAIWGIIELVDNDNDEPSSP
ncbi:hypothetical protein GCM10023232_14000 [Sphingosinicella ginsenosidimutans]|jgi:hypothetical protein|uniref:Uncharacterized protein n=1 Tax=Allosphingosinicella ginsenosidimutans TaxID=1176539 RepID=A0A5C6TS19_9SPHN|nr:hypothetical protein [Sphingosinicella ginsenosidimutans]TXC62488.1 hypothetical protein FRZ32_01735 [Sphingosinicella ginsenosidimutans]